MNDYRFTRDLATMRSIPQYERAIPQYPDVLAEYTSRIASDIVNRINEQTRKRSALFDIGQSKHEYKIGGRSGKIGMGIASVGAGVDVVASIKAKERAMLRQQKYQSFLDHYYEQKAKMEKENLDKMREIYAQNYDEYIPSLPQPFEQPQKRPALGIGMFGGGR